MFRKTSVPTVEVGDVVRVHQKIKEGAKERIQVFEGIVIATHNRTDINATFTVRKIASGVGVERTYLLHSPNIVKIEFKRSADIRRAKLYYLRELTGKALKLKDKKVSKESWDQVLLAAEENVQTEATEADVAEAVAAQAEQEAEQAPVSNEAESVDNGGSEETVEVSEPQEGANESENTATSEEQAEPTEAQEAPESEGGEEPSNPGQ